MAIKTPYLDTIKEPADLRDLSPGQLKAVARELRSDMIDVVSRTGGHLGAGLGVIELTIALHYIFDTPDDILVWDVGHQCYPHKILTGRRDRIGTLRQGGGLSGFTKRSESKYDPFGAAHASTSVSAALGFAVSSDLQRRKNRVVAVIGDGALSGGMAYEALNNAGSTKTPLIVILNDNAMSIAPPVGAMCSYLSRLISSPQYRSLRDLAWVMADKFPGAVERRIKQAEKCARGLVAGGTLFEELGFYYVGPVDGHNIDQLLPILRNVRDARTAGPILVHVLTQKGKGYPPAEQSADKYHGVSSFDVETGTQIKAVASAPSFTKVFGESLLTEARRDDRVCAITAAMPSGTGVNIMEKVFPERVFDVGIAEQHAVTFAAGLAADGMKPFAAIYSTFLQRAYDQIIHDVAIQSLPVRFALDRAGLVGADGQTHAGAFDIAYLGCLPGFVLMAAADEGELAHMVRTAVAIDDRPCAFRYPRGAGLGVPVPERGEILSIGKGRILREGNAVAILSYGARLHEAEAAAEELDRLGVSATVADARFAKPLDEDLVRRLAREHEVLLTIEEGVAGGFGAHVLHFLATNGLLDHGPKVRPMVLPDRFLDQDKPQLQYDAAGLLARHIQVTALTALGFQPTGGPEVP